MRKIIASINMTADGFVAACDGSLDWHVRYWDDEASDNLCRLLKETDTLLLGGNTYSAFADYWPSEMGKLSIARGDIALAEIMNSIRKVVVSKTNDPNRWRNSSVIDRDLDSEIQRLKSQPGKDVIVLGSLQLVQALAKMKQIDRYNFWIHPIVIGSGRRLFDCRSPVLQAINHRVLRSGIVNITYQ